MANITRFDPFNELTRLASFGDADDFFSGFTLRPVFRGMPAEPQIKLEVADEGKTYVVKAEIPGAKKEDIRVSVEGNQISISAEVKKEKEEKEGKKLLRSERYYGKVSRSFTLGQDVDQEAAQANYIDGVLQLTLPKKAGSTAKEVKVS